MNKIDEFLITTGVLDTETTGVNQDDDIIQFSILASSTLNDIGSFYSTEYKPNKPIPPGASAVHWLSDEDVENAKPFTNDSETLSMLLGSMNYLVAHSSEFDRKMLKNNFERYSTYNPEILQNNDKWICTLTLARKLYGQDTSNFKNQTLGYLWFKLGLNKTSKFKVKPHDAQSDVYMCYELLKHEINEFINRGEIDPNKDIGEQLQAIMKVPVLLEVYPNGKYKGVKFSEILEKDRSYLEWMVMNSDQLDENATAYNKDLAETIAYYLS